MAVVYIRSENAFPIDANEEILPTVALMWRYIDTIPYMPLVVITIVMLLTPFFPMPHVIEKLLMLKNGTLHKPIDIFDLFFHLFPCIVLCLKLIRSALR